MKPVWSIFFLLVSSGLLAQEKKMTLKEILLSELQTTHNKKEWFVPLADALQGVTPEQANWTDGSGNHSIGQLVHHIYFWNERILKNLKKETLPEFKGENDETFTKFEKASWEDLVGKLNKLMAEYEKLVENASDTQVQEWANTLTHVSTHNAYHVGQIIYVRKLQGSWNPDAGVK